MIVTSPQNSRIKSILALSKPKERRASGLFTVEGVKELEHAFEGGYAFDTLVLCPELVTDAMARFEAHARETIRVSREVFGRLVVRENSGGVMAVARAQNHELSALQLPENPLILVVEAVEKPGNLGALLRTADGAGLDAVVVCDASTDVYNPNVIRSSVGCVFSVPIAVADSTETIRWIKAHNLKIFATHLQASLPYDRVDFRPGCAIVMGTEATGLSRLWWEASDQNVIIPMRGKNDSLNVSAAAAVVVFEAVRQRQSPVIPAYD